MAVTDQIFSTSIYAPNVMNRSGKKQGAVTFSVDQGNKEGKMFVTFLGN